MTGMSRDWLRRQCRVTSGSPSGAVAPLQPGRPARAAGQDWGVPQGWRGWVVEPSHEKGPRPVFPLVRGLIGVVSEGDLNPHADKGH